MRVPFSRLVRFEDDKGQVHYGEAPLVDSDELVGMTVRTYMGVAPWDDDFIITDSEARIAKVLCPIPYTPIIQCIGLNYKKHAEEANFPIYEDPVTFVKPPDSLAGPFEDISIHPEAKFMDYECEFTFIIGRDCKSLPDSADPLDYVLGYTVGNDFSARYWQYPERSGNQHGYAKSFDKFAPIGPVLVAPATLGDYKSLTMTTKVNGQQRQETKLDDMIYDVGTIVRHLCRGTTLRKGTVVMTGTPSGIAAFMKPQVWLADGDVVEIEIENIGMIRNKLAFEKD